MRRRIAVRTLPAASMLVWVAMAGVPQAAQAARDYEVFVSNEKSGDLTVIDGKDLKVVASMAVGKRPRGLHGSPDGKTIYVALSGTPMEGPPELDSHGNPVFKNRKADDDDADGRADKAADGIGVVDVATRRLTGKFSAGSDPEEFALSQDGSKLYISNEDVKTASVIDIAAGKVQHIIPVGQEPEGVSTTPDGQHFYITCEAGGDVYVVDTTRYRIAGHFKVEGRPRSIDFLPSGAIGFVPSESTGQVHVIDTLRMQVLKTLPLPAGSRPMRVRVASDGARVYVSNGRAGTISVIDGHSYDLLATIKVGARPWGIALSPDGKYLFSANGPSNDVSVVDLAKKQEITRIKAGAGPWGITIVPAVP